ncbi:uncharacterized protein LOC143617496 [Bidens hawaiensis]|uniref:uncharacterized protein LOC143617496 n=1 Tax=Bidens hawaiensis TaxID=980011 RepID=UPI00404B34EC
MNPERSAGDCERTAERAEGEGRKDDEEEREASSVVKSVKVDDRKRGRGGCNYKSLKGCDPPKLTGLGDVIATLQWITAKDKIIRISECRPDQAVGYATQSFEEEAMYWWESVEQRKTRVKIKAMRWEDLKELVMKKFCADAEVERAEMKFLNLKAGTMKHREYTTEFNRMSRLVPDMVDTEAKRIRCYVRGLPQKVRMLVRANKPANFDSVVELAEMVYADLAADDIVVEEEKKDKKWVNVKRPGTQLWNSKDKKQKVWEKRPCKTCGKMHGGECKWGKGSDVLGSNACYKCGKVGHYAHECSEKPACFWCGKTGHMARECTEAGGSGKKDAEPSRPRTRAFMLTQEQAKQIPDVVTGTFL